MAFPRKKRFGSFFFDDDFEDEFDRIREEMERMMGEAFKFSGNVEEKPGVRVEKKGPFVYGFSMRMGPDGKPQFEEFGNVKPAVKGDGVEEREPLVDVIEGSEEVSVVAELPGVRKEDVKVKATEETLSIRVDNPERKYAKVVKFKVKIKPETAKANYKNGVLEVKITRAAPVKSEEKGKDVKVD
ncbi:Hsp20/alpha crystallin family protein [Candidatus Micrarchaeota archaeon]|nr:Hsp20/alpha crystallin family protein [Candidatus Micrarchaeota archaeon]